MEENEIKIGDQTWTTKNLDVETYRNGDAIPQVEDQEEWINLTTRSAAFVMLRKYKDSVLIIIKYINLRYFIIHHK